MATRTWTSGGSNDMNNTANYDGAGSFAADDLVFNATSVVNAAATAAIVCNSITIASTYTGTWALTGYTATCAAGFSDDGTTGAHNYGNGISCSGASSTFHVGSGVGTVTASSCTLTFNGTTGMIFDDDKGLLFNALVLGASAIVSVNSGQNNTRFYTTANALTMINGGRLTVDAALFFGISTNGSFYSLTGSYTINGGSNLFLHITTSSITVSLPALTYTGTGRLIVQQNNSVTDCVCNQTGNLTLSGDYSPVNSNGGSTRFTYNTNGNSISCKKMWHGNNVVASSMIINWGASAISTSNYDATIYGGVGTTENFGTSAWACSGAWTNSATTTYNSETSVITITAACTFTSAGKTIYNLTHNAAGSTLTLSGAMSCNTLTISAGSFTTAANNLTASGNLTLGGTNITLGANVTMTGSGRTIAITAAGTVTTTACVLILQNATTLNLGTRTISRLQCTGGYTYTFTAGSSVLTITNYTAGDWRQGSGTTTWRSSIPGTQYRIAAPANTVVTNMDIQDCNNSAGILINALAGSNKNSGNNVNILFGGAAKHISKSSISISMGF